MTIFPVPLWQLASLRIYGDFDGFLRSFVGYFLFASWLPIGDSIAEIVGRGRSWLLFPAVLAQMDEQLVARCRNILAIFVLEIYYSGLHAGEVSVDIVIIVFI